MTFEMINISHSDDQIRNEIRNEIIKFSAHGVLLRIKNQKSHKTNFRERNIIASLPLWLLSNGQQSKIYLSPSLCPTLR